MLICCKLITGQYADLHLQIKGVRCGWITKMTTRASDCTIFKHLRVLCSLVRNGFIELTKSLTYVDASPVYIVDVNHGEQIWILRTRPTGRGR
jgi:hypothetical protein